MTGHHHTPRLDGQRNFRDLGGYRTVDGRHVRRGCLYRSGVLDLLTDADLDVLGGLGVRVVVDLRSDDEVRARPDRLPPGARSLHLPVSDVSAGPATITARLEVGDTEGLGPDMLLNGNRAFAGDLRHRFADVLRVLMDPESRPAVFHCTAGKDRAGFAAALVLWMLGVPTATVLEDYLRSNELLVERHERVLAEASTRLTDLEPLKAMLEVREEYLMAAVEAMEEQWGSVDGFVLDGLEISVEERERFRADLLE